MLNTSLIPAIFVGHGSPINAIMDNNYTKMLKKTAENLPTPKAILIVSAHWLDSGTYLSTKGEAETIYDFGGFPEALYKIIYPVKGSSLIAKALDLPVKQRGLDHGVWTVLKHMYPKADIPVMQMSINYKLSLKEHFEWGKRLVALAQEGVLIIGSGSITHNFQYADRINIDAIPNHEAVLFDEYIQNIIETKKYDELYKLSFLPVPLKSVHPTLEHYIPLLYVAGIASLQEGMSCLFEGFQYGAFSMRAWRTKI